MIDTTVFLKLLRFADKNGDPDWSAFEKEPKQLFDYLVANFGIDPTQLSNIQNFFIGETQPQLSSIWVYTGDVPFIGIPIGGEFVKFYRFPANAPFVSVSQDNLGSGVAILDEDRRIAWGLPELNSPAFWAILEIVT